MAYVNVTNWLLRRSAGALFNLQKTPYDKTVNGIDANPKKVQTGDTVSWSREFLTNWPADTVFKISASSLAMNKLELETTSTWKRVNPITSGYIEFFWQEGLFGGCPAIFDSVNWSGGNNETYASVSTVANNYTPTTDANGDLVDQWNIDYYSYSWSAAGDAILIASSEVDGASAPDTLGASSVPCIANGTGSYWFSEPKNSIHAVFTTQINAKDFVDSYGASPSTTATAAFCMRKDGDSEHTLHPYIKTQDTNTGLLYTNTGGGLVVNNIFSYRHTTSEKATGWLQKQDTTCKWYYTPNACEDCWYKGKTIKVTVTYKKAPVTYTYILPSSSVDSSNTLSIGSWVSHSTVDYDLTIPEGYTRQQLGSTFTVPTLDGHIVTIDDIKFVSVT